MSVKIEDAEEIEVPEVRTAISKYREVIEEFIKSNKEIAKITCLYIAHAKNVSHGLRDWLGMNENILVTQRSNIVYLKKLK